MASLIGSLERKKQLNGLTNRELQALKDARREEAWHANDPGTVDGYGNVRGSYLEQQRQQELMQPRGGGSGIIGQGGSGRAGAGGDGEGSRSTWGRDIKSGDLVGTPPSEFIYQDLKPGETYDPRTDIFYGDENGDTVRRKTVNPKYQEWVTNAAQQMIIGQNRKTTATAQQRPPDAKVLSSFVELLGKRRTADSPAKQAEYDEQIASYLSVYPALRQTMGGTGGTGGGEDVSMQESLDAMQQAGIPQNVAQKLIGGNAAKPKPAWDWQSEVSVAGYDPVAGTVSR